jgi:LysR family transcriptional regulator, regulator for bpeEF and oprC
VPGFMTFNSGEAMVAAARAGLGVIQVADYYVQPLLERGELVEVLEDYKTDGFDISVVFPQPQQIAPKLRVFLDFLVALFEHPPWRGSGAAAPRAASTRAASRRSRAVTPLPSGTAG